MIPQRTLRNDFAGNELRERIAACRKRVRNNRVSQRSAVGGELVENSGAGKAAFLDDQSAMRESFLSTDLSLAALDDGNESRAALLIMRAQEVGIT